MEIAKQKEGREETMQTTNIQDFMNTLLQAFRPFIAKATITLIICFAISFLFWAIINLIRKKFRKK